MGWEAGSGWGSSLSPAISPDSRKAIRMTRGACANAIVTSAVTRPDRRWQLTAVPSRRGAAPLRSGNDGLCQLRRPPQDHQRRPGALKMTWTYLPPGLDDFFAAIGRPRNPGPPSPEGGSMTTLRKTCRAPIGRARHFARFAPDSALEEAVMSELVSENGVLGPFRAPFRDVYG